MNEHGHHHLGGAYLDCNDANTFTPDIWQYLIDKYAIKSVIDVGCGAGWNTVWWHERGYYATGVEGWPEAIAKTRMPMQRMIVHDYTTGPLKALTEDGQLFDLAWSSEFVEHVEERFIPNYMATFQCAKLVCMTYATPGQGGYHHCLVSGTSVSLPGVNYAYRRFYEGDVVTIVTSGNRKLTVTPNHPILTPEGWVSARLLNKGSYVIGGSLRQGKVSAGVCDDYYRPTPVEKVFASLSKMPKSFRLKMPTSSEDFHGDVSGSEVEIVRTNGLLGNDTDSPGFKPRHKSLFKFRNSRLVGFVRRCTSTTALELIPVLHVQDSPVELGSAQSGNHSFSSNGLTYLYVLGGQSKLYDSVGNSKLGSNLLKCCSIVVHGNNLHGRNRTTADELAGGGHVSNLNTHSNKRSFGIPEVNPALSAEDVGRLTGNVSPDKIHSVHFSNYRGHVFNFETDLGFYSAGDIITHNCNEQDFPYWEAKMWEFGFEHLPEDTAWMRATDNGAAWGRKTLCLFRNVR